MTDLERVEVATQFIIREVESLEGGGTLPLRLSGVASRMIVGSLDRIALGDGEALNHRRVVQRTRRAALISLPADPLGTVDAASASDSLNVFMPMHGKDAWLAHLAVAAIYDGSVHPLRSITLCIPDAQEIPAWASEYEVRVLRDSEVLSLLGAGAQLSSLPGWFLQQILKFAFAMFSDAPTLVHDADTILLRPRTWSSGELQILPLRWKAPKYFARSTAQFLESEYCLRHASSVTHHQLMRSEVLRAVFGGGDALVPRLASWIAAREDGIQPSEYQLYGSQLRLMSPHGWVPAGWHHANGKIRAVDVQSLPELAPAEALETLSRLRTAFPGIFGLSLHVRG